MEALSPVALPAFLPELGDEKRCDLSTEERSPSARRVPHACCQWKLRGSDPPHSHDTCTGEET
jgi:hypothetical protein